MVANNIAENGGIIKNMSEAIPLGIIFNLFIFLLYFLFWIAVFVILYHLTRFGVGVQPKRLAAAFLLGALVFFCTNIFLFANLNIADIIK